MSLAADQSTPATPAVTFRDVSFRYHPDEPDALAGVTLDIMPGEHVAIIGANGSGKSTLARHINALHVPDSGTVTVAGLDTADPAHTYALRAHAGLVFQNPDDQMVASIVRDDVAFGPENLGIPAAEIVTRVQDSLATVGLSTAADEEVAALSGGERQRVAIAGILAMRPAILLLDEPGAMLDPRGRRGIRRVSHELHEAGMTVIVITQHMEEALRADRVIVMDRGSVVCDGPTSDVLTQADLLRSLGLDMPFVAALSDALRVRGVDVPVTLDEDLLEEAICRSYSSM